VTIESFYAFLSSIASLAAKLTHYTGGNSDWWCSRQHAHLSHCTHR